MRIWSRSDTAGHEGRPEEMGTLTKMKVIGSLVALSAIAPLKSFMVAEN